MPPFKKKEQQGTTESTDPQTATLELSTMPAMQTLTSGEINADPLKEFGERLRTVEVVLKNCVTSIEKLERKDSPAPSIPPEYRYIVTETNTALLPDEFKAIESSAERKRALMDYANNPANFPDGKPVISGCLIGERG